MRRDPSRNQNDETIPISEPERNDEVERDERGREIEASEPKNKREKKALVEEKRENSVGEK